MSCKVERLFWEIFVYVVKRKVSQTYGSALCGVFLGAGLVFFSGECVLKVAIKKTVEKTAIMLSKQVNEELFKINDECQIFAFCFGALRTLFGLRYSFGRGVWPSVEEARTAFARLVAAATATNDARIVAKVAASGHANANDNNRLDSDEHHEVGERRVIGGSLCLCA